MLEKLAVVCSHRMESLRVGSLKEEEDGCDRIHCGGWFMSCAGACFRRTGCMR